VRVGLVLGGGGFTGTAFHAGVIAALADLGWDSREAAIIVGTSAGSTSAALLRAGFPPRDYLPRILDLPMSAQGRAVLGDFPQLSDIRPGPAARRRPASPPLARRVLRRPWDYRLGVAAAALLPAGTGLLDGGTDGLRAMFTHWPQRPMWICAVDLADGTRVVFGRDLSSPVADAVLASCAMPGVLAPVEIAGRRYVDGGAFSVHNLDLLAGYPLDAVIVSAPLSTSDTLAPQPYNAVRSMVRRRLRKEVSTLGVPVVVIEPDARLRKLMGANSMAVAKRPGVAVAARAYATARLRHSAPWLGSSV
jgi:NTE family protein